ncbi:MAG: WYL domain-containing transcriptional regulator [Peptococcaceae bacterium]
MIVKKEAFPLSHRSRIYRVLVIHSQVKAGKYPNTPKLASSLEVNKRTIQRDVEFLRDMLCAPLEYSRVKNGYYYTSSFEMPHLNLTEGEQVALFLGQKLLLQCAGTPLEEPIRNAFTKICLCFPQGVSVDMDSLGQIISFDVQPLRGDEQKLASTYHLLTRAIEDKCSLNIHYYTVSRNELTMRKIDPYHLRYFQGVWYLISYCHFRQEVRIFALDRIRKFEVLEETFQVKAEFSLEEYLGSSLGIERGEKVEEVKILFDPEQARWIRERKWHESQKIEYQPDGSLILCIKVSGLGEIKRWALSFGSHTKVLAPVSLQEEITLEIKNMAKIYK